MQPNANQTAEDFVETIFQDLREYGTFYIWKVENGFGKLAELYRIPPDKITLVIRAGGEKYLITDFLGGPRAAFGDGDFVLSKECVLVLRDSKQPVGMAAAKWDAAKPSKPALLDGVVARVLQLENAVGNATRLMEELRGLVVRERELVKVLDSHTNLYTVLFARVAELERDRLAGDNALSDMLGKVIRQVEELERVISATATQAERFPPCGWPGCMISVPHTHDKDGVTHMTAGAAAPSVEQGCSTEPTEGDNPVKFREFL